MRYRIAAVFAVVAAVASQALAGPDTLPSIRFFLRVLFGY